MKSKIENLWCNYIRLLRPLRNSVKSKKVKFSVAALIIPIAVVTTVYAVVISSAHVRGVILFTGDSNVSRNSEDINYALTTWGTHSNNGYVPVLLGKYGSGIRTPDCIISTDCTTTNYWKTKIGETLKRVNPDGVFTNLGINDALSPGTQTGPGYSYYGQKIDWFMSLIPAGKPVFWANLPCAIEPANRLTGCQVIDYNLTQATKRWPNLTIINWASVANFHPEYIISGDVHYTDLGYSVFSNLIVNALDTKFPAPTN